MEEIQADIAYFTRDDKFRLEKPYIVSHVVDVTPGVQVTNHENTPVSATIYNLRCLPDVPSIETEGFTYLSSPTSLEYGDFDNPDKVRSTYFTELRHMMQQTFPQYKTFVFFDYEVRRRSDLFPASKGVPVKHTQPVGQAHVDFSLHGAKQRMHSELDESPHSELLLKEWDMLNIWRQIRDHPTSDWPLALCDFQSMNTAEDVRHNDIVYNAHIGEDSVMMSNPNHKWYYLKDQRKDEVLVWRNIDVPNGTKPRAFHTAFDNPLSDSTSVKRESIEVRVAAFL